MSEGFGLFNFGVGQSSILPCGKSRLLNDFLFPESKDHKPFTTDDKSPFSSGQVDVFFDKNFEIKNNCVYMDGQGHLKNSTIKSVLTLTNIVMLHFNKNDFSQDSEWEELVETLKLIKKENQKQDVPKVILLIRDCSQFKMLQKIEFFTNNK